MLNSLSFRLSVKLLISPSNLKEIFGGQSNLGCKFFPFITLNIFWHSLLACRVSAERSADNLMGIPWYFICCFSLAAFNIFSLCLIFVGLINMCLSVFLLGCSSLCFLDLIDYFLSHIREVFDCNLFKYFFRPFPFLFFFWDPYNSNVGAFNVVPEVSESVLNSFLSFSLFCPVALIFTFYLPAPLFALLPQLFCY